MNTKKVPLFVMLLAGAVACIVTYLEHYSFHDMLVVLLMVLVVFLIIGLVIKRILDKFDISNEKKVDDEGAVLEKQEGVTEGAEDGTVEAVSGTEGEQPPVQ